MNRIPPTAEIIDAAKWLLAPAAISAVAVFLILAFIVRLAFKKCGCDWRRAMPAVSVLAIFTSLLAVNHFRDMPFPWLPDGKWWHFGGLAIAASFVVEMICQAMPARSPPMLLRGLTAGIIAHFIVPAAWQAEAPWWLPLVAIWLAASWSIVAEVARRQQGGAIAFAGSIFAGGAGIVLLHAKSLGLSDLALALAVGLFLLALLAWITKINASATTVAVVVPVLILVWLNRPTADSDVPIACHRILAAVPVCMGLMLLSGLNRTLGTRRGGLLAIFLTLVPVIVAVSIAVVMAPMTFDEEKR